MDHGQISDSRKLLYYVGMALSGVGGLLCIGNLISSASVPIPSPSFEGILAAQETNQRMSIVAIIAIGIIVVGGILTALGRAGLSGSGLVLDPEHTRKDVEPWSRLSGGILADTLDEAKIDLSGQPDLPFDKRLRRLEQLRKDGLVTEAEYAVTLARIIKDA